MPTLYVAKGACSFGAHVVLQELGIKHTIRVVPLRTPDSPIHQVNPLGRVPTLQLDDGNVITENAAILPYLGDLKPEAGLFGPVGSLERAHIQEWLGLLNSDIHGAFRPVNRPGFYHSNESAHATIRSQGLERLHVLLGVLEQRLSGKSWAVGERFTIADAYLGVFLGWTARANLELSAYPNLKAYLQRYNARPSVQAARAIEEAGAAAPVAQPATA